MKSCLLSAYFLSLVLLPACQPAYTPQQLLLGTWMPATAQPETLVVWDFQAAGKGMHWTWDSTRQNGQSFTWSLSEAGLKIGETLYPNAELEENFLRFGSQSLRRALPVPLSAPNTLQQNRLSDLCGQAWFYEPFIFLRQGARDSDTCQFEAPRFAQVLALEAAYLTLFYPDTLTGTLFTQDYSE